jgi:hypothetical protein
MSKLINKIMEWIKGVIYQLQYFNEGLYPPGQIPSRRTFKVKNLAVVKKMFERAGASYKDLKFLKKGNQFQVLIPKGAHPADPSFIAFIDRQRFWSFTLNNFAVEGYTQVTFSVHAYTRVEQFQINILGHVPAEVTSSWELVPRLPASA